MYVNYKNQSGDKYTILNRKVNVLVDNKTINLAFPCFWHYPLNDCQNQITDQLQKDFTPTSSST